MMTTTMTNDEINSIALEAGFDHYLIVRDFPKQLKRFAALVAAHEREACAKVAFDKAPSDESACEIAAAIREKGEK